MPVSRLRVDVVSPWAPRRAFTAQPVPRERFEALVRERASLRVRVAFLEERLAHLERLAIAAGGFAQTPARVR
jgi:hypothetical protein